MDLAQEEMDRIVQAAIDEGYTKIQIIDRDIEGTDIIDCRLPNFLCDDDEDNLGVLCVHFVYSDDEPQRGDPDLEVRIRHQGAVIRLLFSLFGSTREAVASNDGPDYAEIVRDYHAYTLQECHDRVDYCLRVIFIPGLTRGEGQGFCQRHLIHHHWRTEGLKYSCWVDDYDLYRTLREAWARRRNTPSTRYPAGWGRYRGEAYARWIAGEGPMFDTQGNREPSAAPADKETSNTTIAAATPNRERAEGEIASTLRNRETSSSSADDENSKTGNIPASSE